jgi:hypothetical protein
MTGTSHKGVDLKYLRQTNRMMVRIFHDAVFEHSTKETTARTKLHSILQNNEVAKIHRGAVDDADDEWIAQPWRIPAVQIWGKICHKYEGMTDMLTATMMEELANIITCVTADARQRRTIYEADQDFERFGKTLIANFKKKPHGLPHHAHAQEHQRCHQARAELHAASVVVTGPFIKKFPCNHSVNINIIIFFFRRSKRRRNFSLFYFASQES